MSVNRRLDNQSMAATISGHQHGQLLEAQPSIQQTNPPHNKQDTVLPWKDKISSVESVQKYDHE